MRDGVDHINVYSKGETELGRLLSNFARTPFMLGGLKFESVEAWWYWRKAPDANPSERNFLRSLHGFRAKEIGRMLSGVQARPVRGDPTREELLAVYQAKADQNQRVKQLLAENKLPFDHYYVYNGKSCSTPHRWTGTLWSEVKT